MRKWHFLLEMTVSMPIQAAKRNLRRKEYSEALDSTFRYNTLPAPTDSANAGSKPAALASKCAGQNQLTTALTSRQTGK